MSWLAPTMFWLLLLVPAVLLLWFLKIRRTEAIVPSTVLWNRALQDERVRSPFQRLIRNLVLLLQLLAVIFAVIALARPEFGSTRYTSRLNLILLDASASMNSIERDGKKRFEEARSKALEIIDDISGERGVLIRFATRAETLTPVTSDLDLLSEVVRKQKPSSGLSAFPEALELALSIAKQDSIVPAQLEEEVSDDDTEILAPQIDARIFIITDGVLPQWDGDPIPVPVIVEPVGEASSNSGIVTLAARREFSEEGDLRVVVEVRNSGDEPISGVLSLNLDGQNDQSTQRRTLEGGERWTRSFSIGGPGSHQLEAHWRPDGGDALSLDNRAWLVASAPRSIRVARVGAENVLLDDALAVIPGVEVKLMSDPALLDPDTVADEFDVVVWDRITPEVMPTGIGHLVFGARPVQFWPEEVPVVEQPRLVSWVRDDPALRYCELAPIDGTVVKTQPLPTTPGTTPLAECREGALISRFVSNDVRGIVVAFDVLDSPWPLSPSFPFFINAALNDLARIGAGIENGLRSGELIEVIAGPGVAEAKLTSPDLEKVTPVPVLPGGVLRIPADDELGIHKMQWFLSGDGQRERGERLIPVNLLSPLETSIEPRPALGLVGAETNQAGPVWSQGRRHLWVWFLAAALLIMLAEWIVFHRR